MHKRHTGHRREIEDQSTPLGRYFAKCGYQNFSLQIIDCVRHGEDEALKIVKGKWQNRLAMFEQHQYEGSTFKKHQFQCFSFGYLNLFFIGNMTILCYVYSDDESSDTNKCASKHLQSFFLSSQLFQDK